MPEIISILHLVYFTSLDLKETPNSGLQQKFFSQKLSNWLETWEKNEFAVQNPFQIDWKLKYLPYMDKKKNSFTNYSCDMNVFAGMEQEPVDEKAVHKKDQ